MKIDYYLPNINPDRNKCDNIALCARNLDPKLENRWTDKSAAEVGNRKTNKRTSTKRLKARSSHHCLQLAGSQIKIYTQQIPCIAEGGVYTAIWNFSFRRGQYLHLAPGYCGLRDMFIARTRMKNWQY